MKIAICGYGKMGKMVEEAASLQGHEVALIIDPAFKNSIKSADFSGVDVCIEFTHPDQVVKNIAELAEKQVPMVVGTTNWDTHLPEVEKLIHKHQGALIHSSNFSLGIALFLKMIAHAATLMNDFDEYDAACLDIHHAGKKDSPSGTARSMAHELLHALQRKGTAVEQLGNRKRKESELHISSLRVGHVPGTHTVIFDSPADSITLTHTARNREGFALGAIRAAEWIIGKKGVFTMQDLMG